MNCLIIDDDPITCRILTEFVGKTEGLILTNTYHDPVAAINNETFNDVDLIFLDVEMPQMSGIEFLKSISNAPQVIIVSSKDKYAIDSYDADVTDYLLKPLSYARFYKAIKKVYDHEPQHNAQRKKIELNDSFFIKKGNSYHRLAYNEIVCVEALENYVSVTLFDDTKHTIHKSLKLLETKFPSYFRRVHRSYMVNMNMVTVIEDNWIKLRMKKKYASVPIGKSYTESMLEDITALII